MDGFVHLHVHSHYSLLDGAARVEGLVARAKETGMEALALTDHGNLYGAIDFYTQARQAGLKPILGMEAYISPTTRDDRSMGQIQTAAYHLLLLATNQTGWRNLMKLSSRAYLEGFYYRPRIDRELLSQFNEGLICSTACLGGEVPAALLEGRPQAARKIAGDYLDIFGPDRFFIEVQNQGVPEQDQVNPALVALAGDLGVGVIGTNDVHFLDRNDKSAHEVLTCISTGKTLAGGGVLEYSPELYLKSPQEMRQALSGLEGAADNTLRVAEMCDLELDFSAKYLPRFHTPDGSSPEEYLRDLARRELKEILGGEVPPEYAERLERELGVIEEKGYSSYFLIIQDFMDYARHHDIPCSARGSGCATLLGYCLGISHVDPIRYGLLFERFTDPQREEDPDIDVDICQEGRGEIIRYVREKYGHVAQIITYGTLKARAVVRDVGRVMDIPLPDVDAIAKKVPESLGITLEEALEAEPDLRDACERNEQVRRLIDHGRRLEGLARHAGIHAAGVVVAEQPLEEIVPLCRQSDSEDVITQWDGPTCEKAGLMKMDFLGLRTLTIIQRAREIVRDRTGEDIDPESMPLDDDAVFELFREGRTDGIFQFESDGMKGVLLQMQPTRIEDLIAANAMYRPGPMDLIPTYCARKAGREEIPSVHPLVDDILAETYGIMCYQEQVMQVLNRLGKLPLNTALTLIKAISKKKESVIAAERPNFLKGAGENGISPSEAEELFELIRKFAGYGFNKAHSTRYAVVAYQTAYFKTHHPEAFLAATLTFECGDTDKTVQYMAEAERMGVTVAPPDINTCARDFTPDGDRVRFGLAAVRGVGAKAVDAIITARDEVGRFEDLFHFCRNVDLRAVNRTTIESLIKCGAFDSLGASRGAMLAAVDQAIEIGQAADAARRSGQMSLFGEDDEQVQPSFPKVEPLSEAQLLAYEKETLGFYVTSHPLTRYGRELEMLSWPPGVTLATLGNFCSQPVRAGCMIAQVRPTLTKSGRNPGRKMAHLTVEDLAGKCDATIFPDAYEQYAHLLEPESMVFLIGKVDTARERVSLLVDEVIPIDEALERFTAKLLLRLPPTALGDGTAGRIREYLTARQGACPVLVEVQAQGFSGLYVTLEAGGDVGTQPSRALVDELVELLTEDGVVLVPARASSRNGKGRRAGGRFERRSPAAAAG